MEEHEEYQQEVGREFEHLRLELSSQRDSEDGQEDVSISQAGGGSGRLPGVEIIWVDQSVTFIRSADLISGYDPEEDEYWSMVLTVDTGVFDKTIEYDAEENIFEDDEADPPTQTKYRFRIITQGLDGEGDPIQVPISVYGQYREMTTVVDGELYQCLIKAT